MLYNYVFRKMGRVRVFFLFFFFQEAVWRTPYLQSYTNNDFVSVINGDPLRRIFSYTSHYIITETRVFYTTGFFLRRRCSSLMIDQACFLLFFSSDCEFSIRHRVKAYISITAGYIVIIIAHQCVYTGCLETLVLCTVDRISCSPCLQLNYAYYDWT